MEVRLRVYDHKGALQWFCASIQGGLVARLGTAAHFCKVVVVVLKLSGGARSRTRNPKLETRNPRFETRNPIPETRNPDFETHEPKLERRDQK